MSEYYLYEEECMLMRDRHKCMQEPLQSDDSEWNGSSSCM